MFWALHSNPFFNILNLDVRMAVYGILDVWIERHGLKASCMQGFEELRTEEEHRVQQRMVTINQNGGLFGSELSLYMFDENPYVKTFIELSLNVKDLSNIKNTIRSSEP